MRIAADTGGTFTDLVFEDNDGGLTVSKASTTPADPIAGVLALAEAVRSAFALVGPMERSGSAT